MPAGREGWTTPEEDRRRAEAVRRKQAQGETLTREEAGLLGAVASRASVAAEREEAKKEGRLDAFEEEHAVESWTTDPEKARTPHLDEEDREREREIRAKQARGETLTREEAGFLGGVERVKRASGED